MDIEKVKEIIDRKTSIPLDNETSDYIEKAYDIASGIIERAIAKPIKPRMCWKCEKNDCVGCDKDFNRCPNCNGVLDNDVSEEYKHCPDCGQALIWKWMVE